MPDAPATTPSLEEAVAALIAAARECRARPDTLLPDFVLYGFTMDVWEHAVAVQQLSASAVPGAAFANARAALESALDSAFLVEDETKYCYRGAQARVAELIETDDLERRASPLGPCLSPDAAPRLAVERVIANDARDWNERAPGWGILLRVAREEFTAHRDAPHKHWSGLTKEQLYCRLLDPGCDSTPGRMGDVVHTVLSLRVHPGPPVGMRDFKVAADGQIVLAPTPRDPSMARGAAALACLLAANALNKSRSFG